MRTLLILGSKPAPILPPGSAFEALACANASGRSAASLGLPDPVFTVMTSVLTSGHKPANDLALQALRGLSTGKLYLYPRPTARGFLLNRLLREIRSFKVKPWYIRRTLRRIGYRFDELISPPREFYHDLVLGLCGHDPVIRTQIEQKQPSTGMIALAIGLGDRAFDRVVLSGFSFEITHAYAHNPLIDQLGTTRSKHADTDISILRCLAGRHANLYTTEPAVHERAGVPLLPVASARRPRARPSSCREDRDRMTEQGVHQWLHRARRRLSNIVRYGLGPAARERKQADKAKRRDAGFFESDRWQHDAGRFPPSLRFVRRVHRSIRALSSGRSCPGCARPGGRPRRVQAALRNLPAAARGAQRALPRRPDRDRGQGAARARLFRDRHRPQPGRRQPLRAAGRLPRHRLPGRLARRHLQQRARSRLRPGQGMAEVRRLLRPGGLFVVDVLQGSDEGLRAGRVRGDDLARPARAS